MVFMCVAVWCIQWLWKENWGIWCPGKRESYDFWSTKSVYVTCWLTCFALFFLQVYFPHPQSCQVDHHSVDDQIVKIHSDNLWKETVKILIWLLNLVEALLWEAELQVTYMQRDLKGLLLTNLKADISTCYLYLFLLKESSCGSWFLKGVEHRRQHWC